ncbi:hypothetical protein LLG96_05855, partial [bacterium]|nr:hypothetical protein [bacterium]
MEKGFSRGALSLVTSFGQAKEVTSKKVFLKKWVMAGTSSPGPSKIHTELYCNELIIHSITPFGAS